MAQGRTQDSLEAQRPTSAANDKKVGQPKHYHPEAISSKNEIKIEEIPTSPKGSSAWRISVTYQQRAERVCWYGEEPTLQAIEDTLRQTFNLSAHTTLSLRNNDGDIVAISSKLPAHEQFVLEALDNKLEGYGSDSYRSDSSAPSTPDSYHPGSQSPHHTPPLVCAEGRSSKYDRPYLRAESLEDLHSPSKREADDDLANKKKRKRRKANEIDRAYKCTLGSCRKVYGSENALKMHIKLKHPDQQNVSHATYHSSHPSYSMFMQQAQAQAQAHVYNGYPVPHPMHHSPVRPTTSLPVPQFSPTSMGATYFPRELRLQRSLSTPSLHNSSFADTFNVPALIREPTSSKHHLPSIHSLPTLQPSHLPSLPYSHSAPSVSANLFGSRSEGIPQPRAAAW